MKLPSHVKSLLKMLVAAVLIFWLVKSGRLDFGQLFKLMTPFYVATGFILIFVALASNNLRWLILLRGQGFETDFPSTLRLTFIGVFFNIAMPGGVGGDIVKGYYLIQDHSDRKMAAATSVLLDRLIGFFSMTCVGIVALILNLKFIEGRHELVVLGATTSLLFVAFVFLFLTAFSRRVRALAVRFFNIFPGGGFFQKVYESLGTYRNHPESLAYALIVSIITQILTILFFSVVGGAFEPGISWAAYAFVVPLGLIAMTAPVAPAGIGIGQAAFFVLFNWYLGHQSQIGPASITAFQIVQISWGLLGAYFYLRRKAPVLAEA